MKEKRRRNRKRGTTTTIIVFIKVLCIIIYITLISRFTCLSIYLRNPSPEWRKHFPHRDLAGVREVARVGRLVTLTRTRTSAAAVTAEPHATPAMAPLLQRPPPALRLAFLTLVGLLLLAGSCATHAFRILAVFPHPAKSHFAFFEPLVKELAARGHDVTVLSHFPQRSRTPNYTDVSLQGTVPLMDTLTVAQVSSILY